MKEVLHLGVVYLTGCQTHLIFQWLEYEYRPYFHGDYDVLPYLITMLKVNTATFRPPDSQWMISKWIF